MDHGIDTYLQEAQELLSEVEECVLDLEARPQDSECLNRLFRAMHTIKGSGAMFGFENVAAFTHHVETVMDHVRKGRIPVTGHFIDLTLSARDHIKKMLGTSDGSEPVRPEITQKLIDELKCLMPEADPGTSDHLNVLTGEQKKKTETTYRVRFRPDRNLFKRGTNPLMLLAELTGLGECVTVPYTREIPLLKSLDTEICYFSWDIILTTAQDVNTIADVFIFEPERSLDIHVIEEGTNLDMDDILPRLGEILVDRGDVQTPKISEALGRQKRIGEILVASGAVTQENLESALAEQKALTDRRTRATASCVRVPSEKLDKLINLVGELVITQAAITQMARVDEEYEDIELRQNTEDILMLRNEMAGPAETLERLTRDLRDCVLDIRMIPISSIFGKFRRLVRDLSADLGKEIDLITEGGDTELDKTVIEKLNDPLVHLIRNSIDHGIRSPDVQEAHGKPRRGIIRLSAAHRGGTVVITIEDDGMGIDPENIRSTAVQKGIIAGDARLSTEEIYDLMFLPGFSTARQVTRISGRGVGLDVVRREIDALGGSIRVESQPGKYARIILTLPLTLAIIDGLLVKAGSGFFVLPLTQVEECAEMTDALLEKNRGRNMILSRGEVVPFIRLEEIFDMQASEGASGQIVIVMAEKYRFGIMVDAIVGKIQTVIKSLDKNYRSAEGISGATILGDGTVALIIDIPGLFRCARGQESMNFNPYER